MKEQEKSQQIPNGADLLLNVHAKAQWKIFSTTYGQKRRVHEVKNALKEENVLARIDQAKSPRDYTKAEGEILWSIIRRTRSLENLTASERDIYANQSLEQIQHELSRLQTSIQVLKSFQTRVSQVGHAYCKINDKVVTELDTFLKQKKGWLESHQENLELSKLEKRSIDFIELHNLSCGVDKKSKEILEKFNEVFTLQSEIGLALSTAEKQGIPASSSKFQIFQVGSGLEDERLISNSVGEIQFGKEAMNAFCLSYRHTVRWLHDPNYGTDTVQSVSFIPVYLHLLEKSKSLEEKTTKILLKKPRTTKSRKRKLEKAPQMDAQLEDKNSTEKLGLESCVAEKSTDVRSPLSEGPSPNLLENISSAGILPSSGTMPTEMLPVKKRWRTAAPPGVASLSASLSIASPDSFYPSAPLSTTEASALIFVSLGILVYTTLQKIKNLFWKRKPNDKMMGLLRPDVASQKGCETENCTDTVP